MSIPSVNPGGDSSLRHAGRRYLGVLARPFRTDGGRSFLAMGNASFD
jgi:hypothetical protein